METSARWVLPRGSLTILPCVLALAILMAMPVSESGAQTVCTPVANNSVCRIPTGITSNPTSNAFDYVTYAWNSTTADAKTQAIGFSCGTNGFTFTVKDEVGTAATYPISVFPNVGDKIDTAAAPFVLNSNFESITFQCDGAGNWIVE